MKHCQARQYFDQMSCTQCGLLWDVSDPEPPECKPQETNRERAYRWLAKIRRMLEE